MPTFNESIVEDAATKWLGELNYTIGHGLHLAPGELGAGRDLFGDKVLVGRLREAILRLYPSIQFRTLAKLRDTLLPKVLSGE